MHAGNQPPPQLRMSCERPALWYRVKGDLRAVLHPLHRATQELRVAPFSEYTGTPGTFIRQMTSASTPPLNAEEVRELVETHQSGIWRYLRALGCEPSLADDITQDTFLSVLQKPFQQYNKSATAAYLRRVAYNRFITLHRRSGKVTSVEDIEQLDADWSQMVDEDGGEHMLTALRDCLQRLSKRARRALEMRFGKKESRANIASDLGITEHGAKNLMQRAKQKLRTCIETKTRS